MWADRNAAWSVTLILKVYENGEPDLFEIWSSNGLWSGAILCQVSAHRKIIKLSSESVKIEFANEVLTQVSGISKMSTIMYEWAFLSFTEACHAICKSLGLMNSFIIKKGSCG